MNTTRLTLSIVLGLMTSVVAAPALASTIVYGQATFWENRQDVSDDPGSKLPDNSQTNQPMPGGLRVELWDEDGDCPDHVCDETDDDLLGVDYTDSNGNYSFGSIGDYEDIYITTSYEATWGEILVEVSPTIWQNTKRGSYPSIVNFGVGNGSYFRKDFSITCWDDTKNSYDGHCDDQLDVDANFYPEEAYSNILRVLVDVGEEVTSTALTLNGHGNGFNAHWACDITGSIGYDKICIANGVQLNNHSATGHEVGHSVHSRAIDHGGGLTGGTSCSNGHTWNSWEDEKCATAEGWAHFFAAALYWEQSAADPWWANSGLELEGDTLKGNQYPDKCASYHTNPITAHKREANVARFFWDLYDSTTEDESATGSCGGVCTQGCGGGFDNNSVSLSDLIIDWDDFPDGTDNGDNREKNSDGSTDVDGRNARDFQSHKQWACSELYLNCLGPQDQN